MIQYVDDNLAGITTLSLSSSNVSLSAAQARMCMLRMSGVLLGNIQITNANNGMYLVENVTTGSFAITLTDGSLTVTIPQSRRAVVYRDATNGPRLVAVGGTGANAADPIPVGTLMLFAQTAAPTGWTKNTSYNNHGLRVVSGSASTSGSIDYDVVFARTATDSHTLTLAQIPSHSHTTGSSDVLAGNTAGSLLRPSGAGTAVDTASSGGGSGHTHPMDIRVKTLDVILAAKN